MHRRTFLTAALAGSAVGLAGCSGEPNTGPTDGSGGSDPPDHVGLETLTTGFRAPVDVGFPTADRRYVADQSGIVRVHDADGLHEAPLLDLRDSVEAGGEKG